MKSERCFKNYMKHRDLEVWNKAINMVTEIYKVTNTFPSHELYALTNQMRRAAISVPSNISEGCARFSDKETLKFISIAIGSIAELQTQFVIAKNLNYIEDEKKYTEQLEEIKRMLLGITKYLKTKEDSVLT